MDRSQASRRSRSASPQREDRHPDRRRNDDHSSRPIRRDRYDDERGYDRDTGRDDFREIGRRREDDRSAHYRSQDRPRNDKVTGGLRFKGDSKPRDKRERKPDDSRREERSRPLETEVEAGENGIEEGRKERKEKKEKKRKVELPAELMIKVTVNDRLGTKAQIPCYGSDNIGLFKKQVAARIGRPSEMIMLKRQGERPFKDHLTLEDYGVSDGVQLDLELDTGD